MKLIKIGIYKKYNNKVWNLFSDSYHNGYFCLIYPKFQRNKDFLTKLCNVICKGLPKHEIMQNIITKFWAGPELYTEMQFMVQICLTDPKFQHNKDCFTKLCVVICKSLSKYEIIPKIAKKYWNTEKCHYTEKMPFLIQTVLPNFGLSFAKAYQSIKLCEK